MLQSVTMYGSPVKYDSGLEFGKKVVRMILTSRLIGEDCTEFKGALRQVRYCMLVYDLVDCKG